LNLRITTVQNINLMMIAMITKFTCSCGNTDPGKAKAYDGCLGYEALVCTVCGRYYDNAGEHPLDDWSRNYVADIKTVNPNWCVAKTVCIHQKCKRTVRNCFKDTRKYI
jgi:hypothetical protein